jgi:uncharacterized protein (DUF1501 family)
MSDFSRTFQPNSNTGSDHARGSHHIVIGAAVKGGQMYGTFPTLALNGPDDSGTNLRWVPTTGSVQNAATLANWFEVSPSQMATIFPNIGSFPTMNLGLCRGSEFRGNDSMACTIGPENGETGAGNRL